MIEAPRYFNRVKKRMGDNAAMITKHHAAKQETLVNGNVLFIGNSVSTWIFPPTDFNCYFFVKQNKINRATDTVFNMSLIAEHNIRQINTDARSKFDSYVYWQNEDFTRFLRMKYQLSSFDDLASINAAQAINDYAAAKHAAYVLTDEPNMKFFPGAEMVKQFNAGQKNDSCFSYTLFNSIYLLKIR
ncbi:MAG: hypothetical protein KGZ74_12405 [Chitinophagaceae bacterium]|nr:hypothetical protein [Chitinophagaceae bacterium]